MIGIASKHIGTSKVVKVTFLNPKRAIIEIIYPRNILPESPINIFAGLKLWHKKPKVAPNMMKVIIASRSKVCIQPTITIPIVIKYIDESPAAKPSKPSIKLIQLIMATINKIVIG